MIKSFILIAILLCISYEMSAQTKPVGALVIDIVQKQSTEKTMVNITDKSNEDKSITLAVIASLLVPGMGELYAGSFEGGKYYLVAESGLWLTYAGFRLHAQWLRQDARTFATDHSRASFENKDEQYEVNIGNFSATEEYNEAKLRNREYELMYTNNQYDWQWDSDANRTRFKDLRIRSDEIYNNSKFIIAAIVINHVLSAFSAGKAAATYNRALSTTDGLQIQAFTMNDGSHVSGIGLLLSAKF